MTRIFDRNPIQGHRPKPWKPPLSTDSAGPKPKCLGDLVRERAEVEGRIGSPTIGTPGDGDHNLVESWYERHPEKLPDNPQTMTNAAKKVTRTPDAAKVKGQRRRRERERAGRKRKSGLTDQRDRSAYMREYNRKKKETQAVAQRNALDGRAASLVRRKLKPTLHHSALLLPHHRDLLARRAPEKPIKRWTTGQATDNGMRGA